MQQRFGPHGLRQRRLGRSTEADLRCGVHGRLDPVQMGIWVGVEGEGANEIAGADWEWWARNWVRNFGTLGEECASVFENQRVGTFEHILFY
jgi:hypothetical protein